MKKTKRRLVTPRRSRSLRVVQLEERTLLSNTNPPALLLLDPSGSGALNITGNGSILVTGGGRVVIDSSNANAAILAGQGNAGAQEFDITGSPGYSTPGQGRFQGSIVSGSHAMMDPLSSLPVPAVPSARHAAVNYSGSAPLTLSPGTYVGGIKISGTGSVTLRPGLYYLQGGGLAVTGSGGLTGAGALIYNAPASATDSIQITGTGSITLTPETTGTYDGITIFQDRHASAPVSLAGGGSLNVTGTVYAAGARLNLTGNGGFNGTTDGPNQIGSQVVVSDLKIAGNGGFQTDATYNVPLTLTETISPPPVVLPNGTLVTKAVGSTVLGFARPGVPVQLETGSDGLFDEAATNADSAGHYSFPVTLVVRNNLLQVRAEDQFGDVITVTIQVSLDIQAPTVSITSPGAGLTTNHNITIFGQVTDDYSGVASLQVAVDAGPYGPLTFDSTGKFQFVTALGLNHTADGLHTIHFQSTDRAGNVSGATDYSFTLDTTPPSVMLTGPGPNQTFAQNVTVTGQVTDGLSGVASLHAALDGGASVPVSFDASGNFSYTTALPLDDTADGPHTIHFVATDAAGNISTPADFTFILEVCPPAAQFQTWTTGQDGGSTSGHGFVEVPSCHATLHEGDSFDVTLQKTFTIPAQPSVMTFSYSDLFFDTSSTGRLKDAFEVALVDAQGNPLVHPITTSRDAFFNLSEGQLAIISGDGQISGQSVTVDVSQITPGTAATLIFRLVNDDGDTGTSVRVMEVDVLAKAGPVGTGQSQTGSALVSGSVEFNHLQDVSASLHAVYGRTSFNANSEILYAELAVRNAGSYQVNAPVLVAVSHLSDPTARVRGADGLLPDGTPYYDFSSLVSSGHLASGNTTGSRSLGFYNPGRVPFTYDLLVLSELNQPPSFTSTPNTEALLGHSYTYQARASDPEGDTLTFSLLTGPTGMQVDRATGEVTWTPTSADVGNQAIALRVSDGHGGSAEQDYTLAVIQPRPNRPPVITSVPVVDANVNTAYTYLATATDPDSDPLSFSLVSGPDGLTIDPVTGLVAWTPESAQLGLWDVVLSVADGRGGTATQTYTIQVAQQVGNHPPVIVTSPVTSALGGQTYTYPVQAVDPDSDTLTYSLSEAPSGMSIDPGTGLIAWQAPSTIPINEFSIPTPNSRPWSIVTGPDGNLWFTERSKIAKMAPNGTVLAEYSTPTTDAVGVNGITAGPDGNLWYVTETSGKLGRVTPDGVFTEFTIPGGQNDMEAITTGPDGNLWFTLYGAGKIGRITPSGVVTEFALPPGNSLGVAPAGIVAGPDGNLWFTLFQDSKIGKITPSGVVTEYALPHPESYPAMITVGPDGALWFAEVGGRVTSAGEHYQGRIGRITTAGVLTEYAVPVGYDEPYGITAGRDGNLWFTQFAGYYQGNKVGRLTLDGQFSSFTTPTATSQPLIITTGPDGDIWFTEESANKIGRLNASLLEAAVTVHVDDGRGGFDTQVFTINVQSGVPGQIQGTVFNDLNGDGIRNWGQLLVSASTDDVLRFDGQTGAFIDTFIAPDNQDLVEPHSMVFGPDGDLYVVSFKGAILRYDGQTGHYLGEFIREGLGGLATPTDVKFTAAGALLVTDFYNNRVLQYDGRTGTFLGEFIHPGAGGLAGPDFMVFGPDGRLYVASSQNGQVLRFDGQTGAFIDTFVPSGILVPANGFGSPDGLTFGRDGNLYAVDRAHSRILKFDGQTGAFLSVFASGGGLNIPHDLTVGPDGDLYTSDALANSVLRFDGISGAPLGNFPSGAGLSNVLRAIFTPDAEPTLAGWVVYLDNNHNGRRDPGEPVTFTDVEGNYSFANLSPGTYTVAEELPPGWTETSPSGRTYTVTIDNGQTVTGIDFGNQQVTGTPTNRPPSFTSSPPVDATVGQLFRYNALATDPDGDPLTFDLVVKPAGMTVAPDTGIVVWVPSASQAGVQDVVLRVQDGHGGVDLQSFQLTVPAPNHTPVITSAPRGPAVAGLPYQYQVAAQDADGDPLTFHLDAAPDGMAIDPSSGLLTWTPTAAQVGTQHVEITASDNHGASTTQIFDLPVVATATDDPPTILSVPRTSIQLGGTYLYAVQATDPNGDPLAYSLPTAPLGMTIDVSGLVAWQPLAGQLGPNTVQVRVEDGRGGAVTQTFSVTVVSQSSNQPPAITSVPPFSVTLGRSYAYDAVAVDPEGDPLTWSLDVAPAGMSIDALRGTVRWLPTADQVGAQSVLIRVADGQGGYATQGFTITIRGADVPPLITSVPPTTAVVGQDYNYPVRATDADNDPLSFSLTTGPTGMTIDAGTGLIHWQPDATQVGSNDVVVQVEDGQGGFATQSYTIVVVATTIDQPPLITSTPPLAGTIGQPYGYTVTATDPDGDTVLFSLLVAPAGMSIDPRTGVVTWLPISGQSGLQQVTVAATDPAGAVGTQTFSVAVADNNQPPSITSAATQVVTAGLLYGYDVQANDPDGDPITFRLDSAPAGMTIDTLGRIRWSPGIADVGTQHVALTVMDNRGGSITQTYDLAVLADQQTPRVNLVVSSNPVPLGSPVTFVVSATDNVGVTSLNLTINGNPVALDANGRVTLIAQPAGDYTIVASASDAAGNTGLASTTLSVIDSSDVNAPTVDLTSPADGAVITAPVNVVGTASDDNLLYYTLSVAPVSGGPFTEIARGTSSVTDGILGVFDPTGLANDSYTLRLTAVDAGGNVSTVDQTVDVASALKLGNFTLSFTDLTIPVSGIPITVSRTYDSLTADQNGELGYGWRLEFRDTNLRTSLPASGEEDIGVYTPFRDGARVYLTLPGGKREGFTFTPKVQRVFGSVAFYHPAFTPDPGVTDQLSVPDYTLTWTDTGEYYALNGLPYNPADALNFGGEYFLTTRDGMAYTVDATTGQLRSVADGNGNTLTYSDAAIDSSTGQRVIFGRDPQGRITSVTDPIGNTVHYGYDANGDLVSVTDRQANVTRFVYDAPRPHYLTQVIDPLGRTGVRTAYDDQGRLVQLVDAAGKSVRLAYDPTHSTETVTDALGNPTTFEYDDRGNVVTQIDALGGITRRTYDSANNMLTETDPLERTTSYTYDASGNVLTITDPLGNVTRNTYTTLTPGFFAQLAGARPVSLLRTVTDPLGNTTTNDYDGNGNLVVTTDAAGNVTRYTYDSAGNQTSITDAQGHVTRFEYDGSGNLIRQTDALGNFTTFTYDNDGNQLTQTTTVTTPTGPRTLTTINVYDANGHVIASTDAEGNPTHSEYDATGRQTATVDALQRRTEFHYDERGELIETLFADGTSSSQTYDAAGHRLTSTDRAGRTTSYVYDPLGRLVTTIYPDDTPEDSSDNPRTRTEYDAAGQVTAQIVSVL